LTVIFETMNKRIKKLITTKLNNDNKVKTELSGETDPEND